MGGKSKPGPGQRTKNNARPSSSSRSAELLGSTVPTFVGFSAAKDGAGLVAVVPGFSTKEEIDPNIDPNFQIVLKKFGKSDPRTKLKALNEFIALVNDSEEAIVCAALSLWPRYYCQLSADVDHRIREKAQVANEAVMKKCGRSVAPYLKQLIPVWITSQYDTYVPAAMQAQATLEVIFPANKLPDVLGFCKEEIMSYIIDNLTLHTPNTLANTKSLTPEEKEAKFERVIITSLHGYSLFIANLSEAHLDWLCTKQSNLLLNDKFWSYATHQIPQIRTSCYSVIGSLCQRLGTWFGSMSFGKNAVNVVLSQLNDKEANITVAAWENAIILMAKVPEWFKLIDFNEKVLPAICDTLKAGGWGSAGRIAPLMLPLLAQIPTHVLNQECCDVFFEAIIEGAKQRCVVSSKSECLSWMSGLAECIRFVSVTSTIGEFRLQCLSKIIRHWLTYILQSHLSINPYTPLKVSIPLLADLVKFWIKQSFSPQSNDSIFYSQLLRLFWQNVVFVITSQLQEFNIETENKEIVNVHYEFLVGLKINTNPKVKKVLKVKFDSDEKTDEEMTKLSCKKATEQQQADTEVQIKQVYERELNSVVNEVCGLYVGFAKDKNISAPILTPLYSIILEFNTVQVFNSMLSCTLKDKGCTIYNLYTELFLNWLKGDSMRSQAIVDITFVLLTYVNEEQQKDILKSFNQLPLSVVKWCVSSSLAFPYKTISTVQEWLHGDLVEKSLISLTQSVIKEGDTHHATLLKMCFAQDDDGSVLLSSKTCTSIIQILAESLYDYEAEHLDVCSSFASQLATTLCSDDKLQGFDKLLLSLFNVNCNIQQGESEVLSDDTWSEVNSSWQDALSSLDWDRLVDFATQASNAIFVSLTTKVDDIPVDNEKIEALVELGFSLLSSCCKTTDNDHYIDNLCYISKVIMSFNSKHVESWFKALYCKCALSYMLNGSLDCIATDKTNILHDIITKSSKCAYDELNENDLSKLLSWSLFCTKFVDKMFHVMSNSWRESSIEKDSDEEGGRDVDGDIVDLLECDNMNVILGNIVYNTAVVKVLDSDYKSLHWYATLDKFCADIENCISHTVKLLSESGYVRFLEFIKLKALEDGLLWWMSLDLCAGIWRSPKNKAHSFYYSLTINPSEVTHESFDNQIKKHLNCCILPSQSWKIVNNSETILNSLGTVALRAMYLCSVNKTVDVSLSKAEFASNINMPLATLSLIVDKYYQCKELMLYDADFSKASWELVACNASIVKFLTSCVTFKGWDLESHQWDFINITVSSMMQSLAKSKQAWNTTKVSLLSCEVFKLFCTVDKFISDVPAECLKREPRQCISNLSQEWTDIFTPHVHDHLLEIVCKIFETFASVSELPSRDVFYINNLHDAILRFNIKFLVASKKYTMDTIMNHCLDILSAQTSYLLKYMARTVLMILTPALIEADKAASNISITNEDESEPAKPNLSLSKMVKALTYLQECVGAILSPYMVGESNCILLPFTDSYNITLGYLVLWETLLNIVQESITYLQYQYTEFFREGKYVEHLVCAIFRLIPDDSQLLATSYFKTPVQLVLRDSPSSDTISRLACKCLVQSLRVGAVHVGVRGWWGALAARTAQHVERIVRTHVTPILVQHQLNEVSTRQKELPNVEFSIHPSVNEVVCKYTVDSTKMELSIELCNNHPLGIPRVSSNGGPTSNVAWITLFLSHQNGTLWQTIILWLNSIQKKLDSVSECYVCYCKLHPVTGKLPKITCQTCRNKSHSICLKKWFSTSGKSTCPMCRSVINLK